MLENDMCLYLLANADVQTATSANPPVYLGAVPMGMPDSPSIVIRAGHTEPYNTAQGPVNFKKRRMQFDSYHEVYTTALVISAAVYKAVIALVGQQYVNLTTVTVYSGLVEDEHDMPQEAGDGGYLFRRTFMADIFFAEP